MASRHHVAVGEPKVEDVAQQEDCLTTTGGLAEQGAELPLALKAVGTDAEVRVGKEEDGASVTMPYLNHERGFCDAVPFHSWKLNSAVPSSLV